MTSNTTTAGSDADRQAGVEAVARSTLRKDEVRLVHRCDEPVVGLTALPFDLPRWSAAGGPGQSP